MTAHFDEMEQAATPKRGWCGFSAPASPPTSHCDVSDSDNLTKQYGEKVLVHGPSQRRQRLTYSCQ